MSQATNNQQGTLAKRPPPPAFDPERPMLVQPWREFEGRGWLEVQYLGGSITRTVKCKMLHASLISDDDRKAAGGNPVYLGPQEAKDRIVKAGLWNPKNKGTKGGNGKKDNVPELPKKSLCSKDFEGSDEALVARVRSIASNLGERTAAGRIGSMNLTREGKDTFSLWWRGAGANRKVRILSDKKHYDGFTEENKTRLDSLVRDCPFRDDEPVPSKKAEETKDESKETAAEPSRPKQVKSGKKQAASSN